VPTNCGTRLVPALEKATEPCANSVSGCKPGTPGRWDRGRRRPSFDPEVIEGARQWKHAADRQAHTCGLLSDVRAGFELFILRPGREPSRRIVLEERGCLGYGGWSRLEPL
jgi:hypothetical protein